MKEVYKEQNTVSGLWKDSRGITMLLAILVILFASIAAANADEQGDAIINKVRGNFDKLKTLQCDIKASVDISYVDMPPKSGKMYYKSPGKTYIDIGGFSMLPKVGQGLIIDEILNSGAITTIYIGNQMYEGKNYELVKVLPIDGNSDLLLSSLYIDKKTNSVERAELTTKNGTFNIDIKNIKVDGIYLPEVMDVFFKVSEFKLPKSMTGDVNRSSDDEKEKKKSKTPGQGSASLIYSNFKVNKPISDAVFDRANMR
jgi:hypothetical protein